MYVLDEKTSLIIPEVAHISNIAQEKYSSGDFLAFHKRCGFLCWILWINGFIFCPHDRQMCEKCGKTWLRFTESATHADECEGERNHQVKQVIDHFR